MTAALATAPAIDGRIDAMATLGTDVRHSGSAHQALIDAGIAGMYVRKVPVLSANTGTLVEGQYCLENALGEPLHNITVGDDFQVVQFEDNADALDAVARQTGATIANAGKIDVRHYGIGGARAFVSLELPEPIVIGDDRMIGYITAFMSHGQSSNHFIPGARRAWCANQQSQMVREGRDLKVTIRHTSSALERTALAGDTLLATVAGMRDLETEGREMLATPVTDDEFGTIIDIMYPLGGESKAAQTRYDKRVEALQELYTGPTNANITGTAWGAYQAINEYGQWVQGIRSGGDDNLDRARARRALTSSTLAATQVKAYTVIREMYGLAA
jgi:hypothetical protein